MKARIYLLLMLSVLTTSVVAQVTLKGRVFDDKDRFNLAGVTLRVAKMQITTHSDVNGEFELNLPLGEHVLSLNYLGYQHLDTLIKVVDAQVLAIGLRNTATQLKEVMVSTGYQELPKERLTGSFFKVDEAQLNQRLGASIVSRLDGITSSLLIDKRRPDNTNIQIRGLSTLNDAMTSPLIILDNFPYEGDLDQINPNDIESVTVLKDAAASSIWGARAGNGVIVLTSKKPKFNQPLTVSFNSNVSLRAAPNLFTAQQLPVATSIALERFLFGKGYYDNLFNDVIKRPIPAVAEILALVKQGSLTKELGEAQIEELNTYDLRRDMQQYLYQSSVKQQYALSIQGGNAVQRSRLSMGYDDGRSELVGNQNSRLTLKTDHQLVFNKLSLSAGITILNSKSTNNSPGAFGSTNFTKPGMAYSRLADDEGNFLAIDSYYRKQFTDTAGGGRLLDWKYRPLQELENNDNRNSLINLLVNLGADYQITPWLKASLSYQGQQSMANNYRNNNVESYVARDQINRFTQLTAQNIKYIIPVGGILNRTETKETSQMLRTQLNLNKLIGNRHQINAIIGAEIKDRNMDVNSSTLYGYDQERLSIIDLDYGNPYPVFAGLAGNSFVPSGLNKEEFVTRYASTYFNASYTYANRYSLSASLRQDGSNLFGVNTNQKWVPLGSLGILWTISNEAFYSIEWLQQLKLRASYGVSGNVNPNASALTRIRYNSASLSSINMPSVGVDDPPNPLLRWEKVKTFNIGIDFSALSNTLTGSVEYYEKRSNDLINSVRFDPTLGLSTSNRNSAAIAGNGVDLVLNSKNIRGKFNWNTSVLFNWVNYKITKNLNPPSEAGLVSDGTILYPITGYNPYLIVSYRWAGLDPTDGAPRGYLNGKPSKDYAALAKNPLNEQVIHGSALPTTFGAVRNTLNYHQFSFTFNVSYKFGYYLRKPSLNYGNLYQSLNGALEYEDRWTKPGDELNTNVPSLVYPAITLRDSFYNRSEINVVKGGHIRLEEFFISYDFKSKNNNWYKTIQLNAYVNQLDFTLWRANKIGLDPDLIYGLKPAKSFAFGIKVNL